MIKKSEKLGKYILEISEKTTVNNQYEVLTSSQDGTNSQISIVMN